VASSLNLLPQNEQWESFVIMEYLATWAPCVHPASRSFIGGTAFLVLLTASAWIVPSDLRHYERLLGGVSSAGWKSDPKMIDGRHHQEKCPVVLLL
jgi:hypothetical protein